MSSANRGDRIRTCDLLTPSQTPPLENTGLTGDHPHSPPHSPAKPAPDDPRLAVLVEAWPDLPEPIRRAVLAMVEAGRG